MKLALVTFFAITSAFAPSPSVNRSTPIEDCECWRVQGNGPVGAGGGTWTVGTMREFDGACPVDVVTGECPQPEDPCEVTYFVKWIGPAGACPGGTIETHWGPAGGPIGGAGWQPGVQTPVLTEAMNCGEVIEVQIVCNVGGVLTVLADFRFWCTDCGLI